MTEFSKAGLNRLHDAMAAHVARGFLAGAVTLVSRRGETHVDAVGVQSLADKAPMKRETIFRIASMTKPVNAVAAMILVEQGRLKLDAPVDDLLPELANRRVLRSIEAEVDDTVPAARSITLRDLLTFRMGHGATMAMPGTYPIQAALKATGLQEGPEQFKQGPDEFMKRLGSLPLLDQPGTKWRYHTGADVTGVLIARATGKTLGAFMEERIFGPLGMKDTAFHLPGAKLERFATSYRADPASRELTVWDDAKTGLWAGTLPFQSGGGGLVSTADDVLIFYRMMLGKGRLGSVRILSQPAVELMTSDQLTAEQRAGAPIFFGVGASWGFGMAVVTKRTDLFTTPGRFGWDGGYGTSGHADPAEDLVGILLTQRMMDSPQPPASFTDFWTMAYAAIED